MYIYICDETTIIKEIRSIISDFQTSCVCFIGFHVFSMCISLSERYWILHPGLGQSDMQHHRQVLRHCEEVCGLPPFLRRKRACFEVFKFKLTSSNK